MYSNRKEKVNSIKDGKISDLVCWKQAGKKIAIYCAGMHGKEFRKLLTSCGIEIDCFIDNNAELQKQIIDGLQCYAPEMIANNGDYAVIICAGFEIYNTVYMTAKSQRILNIIDFRYILDDVIRDRKTYLRLLDERYLSDSADLFYTNLNKKIQKKAIPLKIKNQRIALYTAAFGDYDRVYIPKWSAPNIDYYYISDVKPSEISDTQWIDAKRIIPKEISDPIKRNRYVKMKPDQIFPQYEYSIYIDANIQVFADITSFICESVSGISVFQHLRRDCLYYEAMTIVNYKRVMPVDVKRQMKRYLDEGMPLHFGLTEMPVIVREHHNILCKRIMDTWWKEFEDGAQRDQLSFMYSVWKNGMTINDLALLGNNVRENEKLIFHKHISDSLNIKNEKRSGTYER